MRILIVTPHFYPESFKCNDMAFELARRGHDVSVMTAIPDYPKGKFFDGYGVFKRRTETIDGVKVYRSLIIPRGNGSAVRLALNYASYTFFAVLQAFWVGCTRKYDAIVVHQLSPVMTGIPAVIIKKIHRIPLYFWVLDLWPESLSAAGGINNRYILGIFERLTRWLYKNSDKILISSRGFIESVCRKGDFADKTVFFPNWVDQALNATNEKPAMQLPEIPDGFVLMYAGNIGDAQDLPSVMAAAEILKERTDIHFVFLGDGRKKAEVDEFIREHRLERTVHCPGRYPLECMPLFFKQADVMFLSLKDCEIFRLTVPARLQAYMSSGKPIIAMLNGEGAETIKRAQCGYSVDAGDSQGLADLIVRLTAEDKAVLKQKGINGLNYSRKHYDFQTCISNLEKMLLAGKR